MLLRILDLVMAALFAVAMLVQYSDPDPIRWMAIYGAGMILSAWAAWKPLGYPWFVPAFVAAVASIWAATIAPRALGRIPLGEMFRKWEMESPVVEENREMF